jgi:hypothetical protein
MSERRNDLAAKIARLREMVAEVAAVAAEIDADFAEVSPFVHGPAANAMVLAMLRRGATIAEICSAAGWDNRRAHSFLGSLRQQGAKVTWTEVNGTKLYQLVDQSKE